MARSTIYACFLLLFWLGMPLGADVVPISESQQSTSSGYVQVCYSPDGIHVYCTSNSFTGAGDVTTSNYAAGWDQWLEARAGASLNAVLTPNDINATMVAPAYLAGLAEGADGSASAGFQYVLVFDLTSPSIMHLTGVGPFYTNLKGPGFDLDEEGSPDALYTLVPGIYTLDITAQVDCEVQGYIFGPVLREFSGSFDADFTPIPEPARISLVLGLLMLVGICFARGARSYQLVSHCRICSAVRFPPHNVVAISAP